VTVWRALANPVGDAPAAVRRGEVSPATWTGLVRDGAYRPLGWDIAVRADLPTTATVRVLAFAGRVPARAVVGRGAAAWVHAGGAVPARLDLLVPPGGRRVDPRPDLISHEAALAAAEVVDLAGIAVTSVQRTGLDVARHLPRSEAAQRLQGLLLTGFEPAAALATVSGLGRARGVRQAAELLTGLMRG
jgi:hypothetical protein